MKYRRGDNAFHICVCVYSYAATVFVVADNVPYLHGLPMTQPTAISESFRSGITVNTQIPNHAPCEDDEWWRASSPRGHLPILAPHRKGRLGHVRESKVTHEPSARSACRIFTWVT
jgi:hypothetical protein